VRTTLLLLLLIADGALSAEFPGNRDSTNTIEPRENYIFELEYWKVKEATDTTNQAECLPDSTWKDLVHYQRTVPHGNWWASTTVAITGAPATNKYFALFPDRIISAFDLFWDGIYVSSNGTVSATQQGEKPGKYFAVIQIPMELTRPGNHSVALRISNWHMRSRWERGQFFFGYYDSIVKLIFAWQIRIYFLLGVIFLAFFLNLFLFFTSRGRLIYLLFGMICLIIFLSLLLNYFWAVSDVDATYLDFRNLVVPVIILLVGIILPIFFLYEFAFPLKTMAAIVVIIVNLALFFWPGTIEDVSERMFYLLAISILMLAVWGIARKREGSFPVLLGTAASGIISIMNLRFGIDNLTIFCFTIILCYTYILAKRFSVNERLKREALLRSVTLENLLLKRTINPHYLLNSLTSVMAWLKKEPAVAIKLVESLSEEFRIVTQISTVEKIPMQTEIELCQTHLRIMSYRKKSRFCLDLQDIDPKEEIPPMIFHTLIENGITHGYEDRTEGKFLLRRLSLSDGVRYILFNDGGSSTYQQPGKSGTGMKYVRARLEESYPGRWSLEHGKAMNGYEVCISLYNHPRRQG
jgi:hypothetical protein